jgi:hypothetical protein
MTGMTSRCARSRNDRNDLALRASMTRLRRMTDLRHSVIDAAGEVIPSFRHFVIHPRNCHG